MELLKTILRPIAKRFVAGNTMLAALAHTAELNRNNIKGIINKLGEHVKDKNAVKSAIHEYKQLIKSINDDKINASLSIKPTHLGLNISQEYCQQTIEELIAYAEKHDTFIWFDMESSSHTTQTITMYSNLLDQHDNIGICIQSYLKQSVEDVERLLDEGGIIRLVKGAYNEPNTIAYTQKESITQNYRRIMNILFKSGNYFAIGTHDPQLINRAKQLMEKHSISRDEMEFQFLQGVQEHLKQNLAENGYTVAEYTPYGDKWLSYYWRRSTERIENAMFALRAIFSG